ncbi:putative membrane protein [Paraburkholderia atlantica]|uniref:hypothetical protein n=1 Tax=Paraburkholderia atlantica TaxID=2654982 RepID=UPI003D2560A6
MKIIAAVRIGRYGRQYQPGEVLDVSERDAGMYVRSRQATYATQPAATKPKPQTGTKRPERKVLEDAQGTPEPATPAPPDEPGDAGQPDDDPRPRKGRYRRRDMRAGDA